MKTNAQIKEWMRAEKGWSMLSAGWHEIDMALDMAREGMVPASQATRPESDRFERIATACLAGLLANPGRDAKTFQPFATDAIGFAKALMAAVDKEAK